MGPSAFGPQSFPAFDDCFLKLRQSSGLLGAKLSPVALESDAWKPENQPNSVEEVADGLQSRSVETRSAVCAARRRRDGGAGGARGAQEIRPAATRFPTGGIGRASRPAVLRERPPHCGGRGAP